MCEKYTDDLRTQEKLLIAGNRTAAMLLVPEELDFGSVLWKSLEILGASVDADRAYIWRSEKDEDGERVARWIEVCEWARCAVTDFGGGYRGIPYDELLPAWRERLLAGENVNLILDADARAVCGMHGVRSMLCIPLTLHGAFWGLIGFDDCRQERLFTEQEQALLKSCGMLIAAAILRNEMMEKLVEARERALTSMRAKSEFLSRMSHEIRTPMNAIIGMTAIARKTKDASRVAQCLEKIDASSRQLLGIINDVLDMSKIDAGKLEIAEREFDFEEMVRHVFDVVQVRADEKRIALEFFLDGAPLSRRMKSDELRLSQVLINLMNNAVKFTPECGVVALGVRETATGADSSRLRVEVRDNGIGIAPERIPRLFDSFEQADGGITRQYGGTGLGLAIVKRIIALMDGAIWVESEPGVGSAFIFEIEVGWGGPCRSVGVRDCPEASAPLPVVDWSGRTILLADDIEINREIVRGILEDTGVAIDVAQDGAEAVRMFAECPGCYDLILMDMQMPVMDGLSACRAIRACGCVAGEAIPILAMTANAFKEDEAACLAAGMNGHIAKPLEVEKLLQVLSRYLG